MVDFLFYHTKFLDTLKIRAQVYASENVQVSALVDANNVIETITMFDDGLHGDLLQNDDVWGVKIPILSEWTSLNYRVKVITDNSPRIAPCEFISASVGLSPSEIKINEFMSKNSSVVADEFFEFEDWCELYNTGSSPIELNAYYLTDNLSRPDKYKLPQEIIQSEEHTLYWLDNNSFQGDNHAPFKLSSEGEELALFEKEGNDWFLRDYKSFGSIQEDISYGRVNDGASQWQLFEIPTPNFSNNILNITEYSDSFLKLWPNPTESGEIYFSHNRTGYIYDLVGNKVSEFINTNIVDIRSCSPGLYILKTIQGDVFSVVRQ